MEKFLFYAVLWSVLIQTALADPPSITEIFPLGGQAGQTVEMKLSGKLDPWPVQIWSDSADVRWTATTNKGIYQAAFAQNMAPGPHLIRAFNNDGASDLRLIEISHDPQLFEHEPNDHFAKAQPIDKLPVVVNGKLDRPGDVDSFLISVTAGDVLSASVRAFQLGSKIDAVLRVLDTNGVELAFNHDGGTLDPVLQWRAPHSARVVAQLFAFPYPATSDVRFGGGEGCAYRLRLQVNSHSSSELPMDNAEQESVASREAASALDPPAQFRGRLESEGKPDEYTVALKKDQWISLIVRAGSLGSALEPCVRIIDSAGKELVKQEPSEPGKDPQIEWRVPSDGSYRLQIESLTHRAGWEFFYRGEIKFLEPELKASAPVTSLVVEPGRTNELKISIQRLRGFDRAVTARVAPLPDGVAVAPVGVSSNATEVLLRFDVSSNAPAFSGPIRVLLQDSQSNRERTARASLATSSVDNGVPGGFPDLLIKETDRIWLTVRKQPVGKK